MESKFAAECAVLVIVAVLTTGARAQQQPLAAEGHGLLPEVPHSQGMLNGTLASRPFTLDAASGVLSRTVFAADAPNLHIEIRDYAAPPDRKPHIVSLKGAAVLVQARGSSSALQLGKNPVHLKPYAIEALPPTNELSFLNSGDRLSVTRVILLQVRRP